MDLEHSENVRPPEWLEKLENRIKRDHKLAHEVGSGSPCLNCHDACEGLDLHFWRKICRNCKCKKEEHDVQEESVDVHFSIVFGSKNVSKKKPEKLKLLLKDEKHSNSISEEVQLDWVPPNISTDLAEKYFISFPRNRMPISGTNGASHRIMQLKKQIPLHDLDPRFCHQLSKEEKERLEDYSNNMRQNAVGQAQVITAPMISLLKSHPQEIQNPHYSRYLTSENTLGAREPGSIKNQEPMVEGNQKSFRGHNLDNLVDKLKISDTNNGPVEDNSNWINPDLPASGKGVFGATKGNNHKGLNNLSEFGVNSANIPIQTDLGINSANNPIQTEFGINSENNPIQKVDNTICENCKIVINPGDVAVVIKYHKTFKHWHPNCFICTTCQEFLVDLIYFIKDGKVYCGRDYAVVCDIPRCMACDELIFSKEYTFTEGKNYHLPHFCCFDCDILLADKEYVIKFGNPVCLDCYSLKYAKVCSTCQKKINAMESGIDLTNLSWHATEGCFFCHYCKKSLVQSKFTLKNSLPFCSKNCVQEWTAIA